jgi:hypothetical protein
MHIAKNTYEEHQEKYPTDAARTARYDLIT